MPLRPVDNPPNPWASEHVEWIGEPPPARLRVLEDRTRTIVAHNDSPDIGFDWSVNPYRGCMHACAYCYARPTHEFLDLGAGTDFDRTIVVKPDAPALLRAHFERASWRGELIAFSGVTDCYQPLEASYELTRACLEVCLEYRQPVTIITKAPLIERDVDLLVALHERAWLRVSVSIPLADREHARALEPWVATPERRMETIARLSAAGLDVGINVAPVIPGLGEADIPRLLEAAADAGATRAAMVTLRLPGAVARVFETRVRRALPLRADRILSRVRDTRGGELYDARWTTRQRGTGRYAASIAGLFSSTCARLGLRHGEAAHERAPDTFARPGRGRQLALF